MYVRRRLAAGVVGVALVGGGILAASALDSGDGDATGASPSTSTSPLVSTADPTATGGTTAATSGAIPTSPATSGTAATTSGAPATPATSAPTVVVSATPTTVVVTTQGSTNAGTRDSIPSDPTAPVLDAPAYGVYDLTSGSWLTAKNADARRPVGSIIKLLTAKVVLDAGDPTKVVTVPALNVDPQESAIGLYAGEQLPRDVLLRAMLIVSANDAAQALAIDVGGSRERVVEMMNATARDLGLADTVAANPSGLDADGAFSTARDAVTLAAELMQDPTFRATVARPEARLHGQTFLNTNDLLGVYPGADGIKTGSTSQAGFGVVASATRDGRTVVVVVLGAVSDGARFVQAAALLDWAFARSG